MQEQSTLDLVGGYTAYASAADLETINAYSEPPASTPALATIAARTAAQSIFRGLENLFDSLF